MDSLQSISPTRHTLAFARRQQQPTRDTQSWTTTRCHRLLRPLKTHICALKREIQREKSELLTDDGSGRGALAMRSQNGRIQHTYSRRGRKPVATTASQAAPCGGTASRNTSTAAARHPPHPGEILLPTPFLRRARGGQQPSSPVPQPALQGRVPRPPARGARPAALHLPGSPGAARCSSAVAALEIEMLPLRGRFPAARVALYESLLRALHALLVATAGPATATASSPARPPGPRNTKSLVAMCLRRVPAYIGELEYWERRDAEDQAIQSTLHSSEVSNRVYEALEYMLPSTRGCPHLRAVVREHGTKLVRDAVAEGLLDDSFSLLLVALCFRTKAFLEAEGLLETILDRSYPRPKKLDSTFDEGRRLAPLKMLRDFARESNRPQFMLRQLTKLIAAQQLPVEWLSTKEFAVIWSGVVKALSGDAACDDAVSFAVHFLTSLYSQIKIPAFILRPERGDLKSLSQQTLLSAITALVSMALLRQEAKSLSIQSSACAISERVGYSMGACIIGVRTSRKPGWISTVLNLAAHVTNTARTGSKADISELWHRILQDRNRKDGKGRQHYEAATYLLYSLASCCARGAAEPAHHHLSKLFRRLDSDASAEEGKSWKLQLDCAFLLAERTNDMRDLAFAESFGNAAGPGRASATSTPTKTAGSSPVAGFRWDGDISEWVTATPASSPRRTSTKADSADGASVGGASDHDNASSDAEAAPAARTCRGASTRAPTVWGRTRAAAPRTRRCAAPQSGRPALPAAALPRKRRLSAAGLRRLRPSDVEDGDGAEDGDAMPPCLPHRGRHQQRPIGAGQENKAGMGGAEAHAAAPKKRRRVAAADAAAPLQPHRAILRTITYTGPEDLSDDELGF